MIKDGLLTHCCAEGSFWNWELSSEFWHELLLAVLTTFLAYQTAAFCMDLLFGFKERGKAKVSDLAIVLLVEESSLRAVLTNLCPSWFNRRSSLHFDPSASINRDIERDRTIPFRTAFKLMIAISVAPLLNFAANALVLERDKVISFGEARFGGVVLSYRPEPSTPLRQADVNPLCGQFKTSFGPRTVPLSQFFVCKFTRDYPRNRELTLAEMTLNKTKEEYVEFSVTGNRTRLWGRAYGQVQTNGSMYGLRVQLSPDDRERALLSAAADLLKVCGAEKEQLSRVEHSPGEDEWAVTMTHPCVDFFLENATKAFEALFDDMTMVDSERFDLLEMDANESSPNKFIRGDELPLFLRTRGVVNLSLLLLICVLLSVIRWVFLFLTNNDIDQGLETVFKDQLGVKCCDSALEIAETVSYHPGANPRLSNCEDYTEDFSELSLRYLG